MKARYLPCLKSEIPDSVRFDIPQRNQGQPIEVAYGGFDRGEHDIGAEYKRVHDRSLGPLSVTYYKLFVPTERAA